MSSLVLILAVGCVVRRGRRRAGPEPQQGAVTGRRAGRRGRAGRVLFAFVPNVQPVTIIVAVTGATLGARAGIATGGSAALASNAFLGQGPWTPWQMIGWGLAARRRWPGVRTASRWRRSASPGAFWSRRRSARVRSTPRRPSASRTESPRPMPNAARGVAVTEQSREAGRRSRRPAPSRSSARASMGPGRGTAFESSAAEPPTAMPARGPSVAPVTASDDGHRLRRPGTNANSTRPPAAAAASAASAPSASSLLRFGPRSTLGLRQARLQPTA